MTVSVDSFFLFFLRDFAINQRSRAMGIWCQGRIFI